MEEQTINKNKEQILKLWYFPTVEIIKEKVKSIPGFLKKYSPLYSLIATEKVSYYFDVNKLFDPKSDTILSDAIRISCKYDSLKNDGDDLSEVFTLFFLENNSVVTCLYGQKWIFENYRLPTDSETAEIIDAAVNRVSKQH
jgi:hypothetical protein